MTELKKITEILENCIKSDELLKVQDEIHETSKLINNNIIKYKLEINKLCEIYENTNQVMPKFLVATEIGHLLTNNSNLSYKCSTIKDKTFCIDVEYYNNLETHDSIIEFYTVEFNVVTVESNIVDIYENFEYFHDKLIEINLAS